MTRRIAVVLALLVLTSCGGGGSAPGSAPSTFQIGGTVSGLASGASLTLSDNGTDLLTINTDGMFTFPSALKPGASYTIAIAQQPSGEQCFLANAAGVVSASNVTNVDITCGVPMLTVLAGALGGPGNIDGQASAARFYYPQDVAMDNAGNFYVADDYNRQCGRLARARQSQPWQEHRDNTELPTAPVPRLSSPIQSL